MGKPCYGKTPIQTFIDSTHLAQEKQVDEHVEKSDTNRTRPDSSL